MSTHLDWLEDEIQSLKDLGFYNRIRTISSPQGPRLVIDGKSVLNFCSNNYLGLANHPRMREAAREAMERFGVGPAAVRTIAGTTDLHVELEKRLARFKGVEDVITFQSGFTANLGAIAALVGKRGCGLFGPIQSRIHHRRLPAVGRDHRGVRAQRPGGAGSRDQRECRHVPARAAGDGRCVQHGWRYRAAARPLSSGA